MSLCFMTKSSDGNSLRNLEDGVSSSDFIPKSYRCVREIAAGGSMDEREEEVMKLNLMKTLKTDALDGIYLFHLFAGVARGFADLRTFRLVGLDATLCSGIDISTAS